MSDSDPALGKGWFIPMLDISAEIAEEEACISSGCLPKQWLFDPEIREDAAA